MIKITDENAGQRLDNFLISTMKGVPKSRIYKAIRKGEVRVNKGRVQAIYRLKLGDQVRIPPLRTAQEYKPTKPSKQLGEMLESRIIYEDDRALFVDKPSGMPVHGGSSISAGLIEMLRLIRPQCAFLELVHRIDRETSGCLLIAKKRAFLREMHALLVAREVDKCYLALVFGRMKNKKLIIDAPLKKNILQSGERMVKVDAEGRPSKTIILPLVRYANATLVMAKPVTGRTHQIRAHLKHIGHPIAGDEKYGMASFDRQLKPLGLNRLFLHSASLEYCLENSVFGLCVPLPESLKKVLLAFDIAQQNR